MNSVLKNLFFSRRFIMAEYNYGNDDIMVGVGGAAPLPNGQQPPVIGGAARVGAGAPQV